MSPQDVRIPDRHHLYTFSFFSSVCIPHIPSISSVYTHYRVTHMSLYPPPRPLQHTHVACAHGDLIPLYTITTIPNFYSTTPTYPDIHHTYTDIQHQHTHPFLTTIPKSVSRRRRPLRLFEFEIPVCSGRHGRAFVLFVFSVPYFGHCTLVYLDTLRGPTLCLFALHNFSFVQNTVVLL
jgi:hypothetical protein